MYQILTGAVSTQIVAQDNSVIEVWVVRDKEGVSITTIGTDATGTLNAVSIRGAQDQEDASTPITIRTFAALIVNAETEMIIATETGTAVSVQPEDVAHKALIVEMDKEVSGCVVRVVVNLAHYLRWP